MRINDREQLALVLLRVTLALLIAVHGWYRFLHGNVGDLGNDLDHRGYPLGILLACAITGIEMIGPIAFALGRLVLPLSLIYVFIYSAAIFVYHLPNGWFSSGTDTDGCEFPVLLVVGFICVAFKHMQELRASKLI